MSDNVINWLLAAAWATITDVILLIGPAVLLGMLMHSLAGYLWRLGTNLIPQKAFVLLVGWLGIPLHEMGHALFCLIFRHKITEIKPLILNAKDGTYGYVKHTANSRSIYQSVGNFFIGVGPIIVGALAIYLLSRFLFAADIFGAMQVKAIDSRSLLSIKGTLELLQQIWNSVLAVFDKIIEEANVRNWRFWAFWYVVFSIGSTIRLSPPDLKGARQGLLLIMAIIFAFNLSVLVMGLNKNAVFYRINEIYSVFYVIMAFAFVINIIIGALLVAANLATLKL